MYEIIKNSKIKNIEKLEIITKAYTSEEIAEYLLNKDYGEEYVMELLIEITNSNGFEVESVDEMSIEEFKGLQNATSVHQKGLVQKPFSIELEEYIRETYNHIWISNKTYIDISNSFESKPISTPSSKTSAFKRLLNFKTTSVVSKLINRIEPCLNQVENFFMNTDMKHGEGSLNIYRRNKLVKKTKDFPTIKFFLEHVYGKDRFKFITMFMKATIDLKPLSFVPVIQSKQGLGKGTVNKLLSYILHPEMLAECEIKEVTSDFSYMTMRSIWMNINELDSRNFSKNMETLKDISGRNTIPYNIKYGAKGEMKRYFNMIISTNKENLSDYLDKNERRFIIFDRFHKKPLKEELKSRGIKMSDFHDLLELEAGAFSEYLDNLVVTNDIMLDEGERIVKENKNILNKVIESLGSCNKDKFNNLVSEKNIKIESDDVDMLFRNKKYSMDLVYNILKMFNPVLTLKMFKEYHKDLAVFFKKSRNTKNVLDWKSGKDDNIYVCGKTMSKYYLQRI